MAELGQTGAADEAGVAGAEECDPRHRLKPTSTATYLTLSGFRPLAIAIIVSLERLSSSELTTQ